MSLNKSRLDCYCVGIFINFTQNINFIMKHFIFIILLFYLVLPGFSQNNSEKTTYFLIRHAEKEQSNSTDKNPHLNAEGFQRALQWSQVFKDLKIDSVYTTNFYRTIETANPTAASHHIKPILYDPTKINYAKFKEKNKGKTVLIVGHSNTIPDFVNALIGQEKYSQIADTNNANLYIVSVIGDEIIDVLLYIK